MKTIKKLQSGQAMSRRTDARTSTEPIKYEQLITSELDKLRKHEYS